MNEIAVSVIMPAYNAAGTIGEALASLQAQTFTRWEVIVVDDGSTDETAAVVEELAREDGRIHLLQQANAGGGAARNRGLVAARHPWLLFFDADDWLLPDHLAKLTAAVAANPTLDAAHCGWQRVSPDGETGRTDFAPDQSDLFPVFARECAFLIHTCLVKREIVMHVGNFDTSLKTCQDWDLWQRVARAGTRFGAVPEVLALYRSRPGSVSLNGTQQLQDSLRVIGQAYGPDARVPDGPYAAGLPAENAGAARIRFACWSFGLMLGSGMDVRPHLALLAGDKDPELDPEYVAACLFEAGLLPQGLSSDGWDQLWPTVADNVANFLTALERHVGAADLAADAQQRLAWRILAHSKAPRPYSVGPVRAVRLEIAKPLPQFVVGSTVERLRLELTLQGDELGAVSLPITAGRVAEAEVRHAIADAYAWPILMHYFELTLFPQLTVVRGPQSVSVWRGDVCLGTQPLLEGETALWAWVQKELGWTLLLQEVWQRPHWPHDYFYDELLVEAAAETAVAPDEVMIIRPGQPVLNVTTAAETLTVRLAIGADRLPLVKVPVVGNRVPAAAIRRQLTVEAGFRLCQLVVAHTLVGNSWEERLPLAVRLKAAINLEAKSEGMCL